MHEKLNLVFDLFGVIFHIRKWRALRYLGLQQCFKYLITTRKSPFHEYLLLLDKLRKEAPSEFQDVVTYKGIYLPATFCKWMKGQCTSEDFLQKALSFIDQLENNGYFKDKEHKQIVDSLLRISIVPEVRINLVYPSNELISLVQDATKKGHKCYVLSNIDSELAKLLETTYSNIFQLFSGAVVSCNVELLKPQQEIYEDLLNKYELIPQTCYFIDDQQENIETAKHLGMHTHLFKATKNLKIDLNKYR